MWWCLERGEAGVERLEVRGEVLWRGGRGRCGGCGGVEGLEGVRALRNTETRGETDSLICWVAASGTGQGSDALPPPAPQPLPTTMYHHLIFLTLLPPPSLPAWANLHYLPSTCNPDYSQYLLYYISVFEVWSVAVLISYNSISSSQVKQQNITPHCSDHTPVVMQQNSPRSSLCISPLFLPTFCMRN